MRVLWALVKLVTLVVVLVAVAGISAFLTFQFATVSRSVTVPDVVGASQAEATRRLDQAGLRIAFEEDERNEFHETIARDHVLRQDPAAGTSLRADRQVRIVLSLGPRRLYVPRVAGEMVTTAQLRLQEAGVGIDDVLYVTSAEIAENHVIDQQPREMPPAGEPRVRLLASSGRPLPTYVMPDLIGHSELKGRAFLEIRGFRVRVESEAYEGLPAGTVVRQKPLSGYPVREGDAVALWVSRGGPGEEER